MGFPKDMPVLFILMRTDLASMNPGKAIIQGSHAANMAVYEAGGTKFLKEWEEQAGGYGTGVSFDGGSYDRINEVLLKIEAQKFLHPQLNDVFYGWLHDPTYPLRDGDVTHFIPLDTCAYVFCRAGSWAHDLLDGFDWHP